MKTTTAILAIIIPSCLSLRAMATQSDTLRVSHDTPGAMNPVIPGYFADPTVKKFGDTYYMYATTDGSGAGFGPAQVWTSKDFVNWTIMPMNWPDSHWIWAPDVMLNENDGRYYYVYCQPCQIHAGSSDTPRGPWHNILGDSEAVLVPDRFVTGAITLDGQTFVDTDGAIYMYWGTWGIYEGFGCGAGRLAPDMKSFTETRLIPNTEATKFFEAPFVLKRDGKYYFMYSSDSCHDSTYHVQYAVGDKPMGPYTYKGTVLRSSDDGTVHGPGHHSVLQEDGSYYIVYHRHDNPHSNRGFHRQLCADVMEFDTNGDIKPVTPTHRGIGHLAQSSVKGRNLAFCRPVTASSFYDSNFKPQYAVDDNNGTLWRPASMGQEWITVDLGRSEKIRTVWTQWEYGTQFYQYLIETSTDGKHWRTFADKRQNRLAGSPMVDFGDARARYVRVTFTGGQKAGFPGALWNIKVFATVEESSPQQWIGVTGHDWDGLSLNNVQGQLGGAFSLKNGSITTRRLDSRQAFTLSPHSRLVMENPLLDPYKEFTVTALTHDGDRWVETHLDGAVRKGMMVIETGDKPLTLANVRLFNWKLEKPEASFYASSEIVRQPVADTHLHGLVVDFNVNGLNVGDTIPYLANGNGLQGYFETTGTPAILREINGIKGLEFDGRQVYTSSFALPATLRDNAPYTLMATIFNPTIQLNECYADFTSSHEELEKIMGVNGTEPRCGVMQHYGWYEDAGWNDIKSMEGKWQDIYVAFDGRIERVYINGILVSEKDIQLLVKPSQYVTIGRNAEHEWPFTGLINSVRLYDEYIPYRDQ